MIQRFRKLRPLEYMITFIYYIMAIIIANILEYDGTHQPLIVTVTYMFCMWICVMVVYIVMGRFLSLPLAKIAYIFVFGGYLVRSFILISLDLIYSMTFKNNVVLHYILAYVFSFIVVATSLRYYRPLKEKVRWKKTTTGTIIIWIIIMFIGLLLW